MPAIHPRGHGPLLQERQLGTLEEIVNPAENDLMRKR